VLCVLIRLGYEFQFDLPKRTPIVSLLYVHPSRIPDLAEPDEMRLEPAVPIEDYTDSFGNRVGRFVAPEGSLQITGSTLIRDSGMVDRANPDAREHPVEELPHEVLQFLLNSRYCEVDRLAAVADDLFGHLEPGWNRVQAICDWVHRKVTFGYRHARYTKTALDTYTERAGVCRDFQHLAVTFCRALNIPARYVTGYLSVIGTDIVAPMDFSAWFQVYLDGEWWDFDARNNTPRIGRILMAVGRDASDVAMTTSFGVANLTKFEVVCEEE
jgi:transglutaminase-like putative cysteine protease